MWLLPFTLTEVLKYIENTEKQRGITPDPQLAEIGRRLMSEHGGDSVMVLIM